MSPRPWELEQENQVELALAMVAAMPAVEVIDFLTYLAGYAPEELMWRVEQYRQHYHLPDGWDEGDAG